jgi:archaeal flagellar protein FlaI
MICMQFTELRIKKIASNSVADIYAGLTHNFYEVKNEVFSKKEFEFAKALHRVLLRNASFATLSSFKLSENFSDSLREQVMSLIELNSLYEKMPSKSILIALLTSLSEALAEVDFVSDKKLFANYVISNSVGLKQLSFFSLDNDLEEIMINDLENIFVFHKEHGMCKTNLTIDERVFSDLLQRIVNTVGKTFNAKEPLLDARLPDGSRVNATYDAVSPKGVSLTIRKFFPIPVTILDLIEKGTITSEAAAFLWLMVEGNGLSPKNILITGGTACGKTTFLNVLSNFMRISDRVISIEDTLEIALLGRENWVALEASSSSENEVTMDSLLKNSLRMRPDRIIVGEVRGKEALTLFTAMDTGHSGCIGTVHAKTAKELTVKLQEKPFEVPRVMLPLVDLIVSLNKRYSKQDGIMRQVVQISEVTRMDDKVLLADVFAFDNTTSTLKRSDVPSHIFEELAEETSSSKNELKKEMETRQLILEWLLESNVRDPLEVLEFVQSYYYDSKKVLSLIYSSNKK